MDIKWKSLTSKERRHKEARVIIILVETDVYCANTSCNNYYANADESDWQFTHSVPKRQNSYVRFLDLVTWILFDLLRVCRCH